MQIFKLIHSYNEELFLQHPFRVEGPRWRPNLAVAGSVATPLRVSAVAGSRGLLDPVCYGGG